MNGNPYNISFLTHEVGSLRKPNPLIKASNNQILTDSDFSDLDDFLRLLNWEETPNELIKLLKQAGPSQRNNLEFHEMVNKWRVRLNIAYKESTGIDLIDAGEWIRREMYQHVIDNDIVHGIQLLPHIRSFDVNFWRPGIFQGSLSYNEDQSIYLQEYLWAKEFAAKPLKVCITSFYTVAEWTIKGPASFEDLFFEIIDTIFVPEMKTLLKSGVNWIQMDEPALTTHPNHMPLFVEGWNHLVSKIQGDLSTDTVLSIHNCFSDYNLLWPILPELKRLGSITLEFANRDSWSLGTTANERQAYAYYGEQINNLYESGFKASAALGVIPVHTKHEPSPELIRDRLLYINKLIGNPNLVLGAPDCGLRQRTLAEAHKMLTNLVKGAELARKSLE
jgi:5-methyltetrahydropteroyltriglutamate--homocysteine methyltransferase